MAGRTTTFKRWLKEQKDSRVTRCKAHYGDESMTDIELVNHHLQAIARTSVPPRQIIEGIMEDTGLSRRCVERALDRLGAKAKKFKSGRVEWYLPDKPTRKAKKNPARSLTRLTKI